MPSSSFQGYVWPVTEKEGGLPLFNNCEEQYEYRCRRPRNPKKGDILFFYSQRRIIGSVPVTKSACRINNSKFERAVEVDFGAKQVFDPPILIDKLANVCRVLKGKVGGKMHATFRAAPILTHEESKILLKMGTPVFQRSKLVKELTPRENVDLIEDLGDSLRSRRVPPERTKQVLYIFRRNQKVIKDLKKHYDGICQLCAIDNLIETDSGEFYTEGHHVIPLGEKGYDDLGNVVILCPLCHKKLHYSKDRAKLKEKILYSESHESILEKFQ